MSNEAANVRIVLEADDQASLVIENLRRSVRGLQRDLSRSFGMKGTRQALTAGPDPRKTFGISASARQALAFQGKMDRLQAREVRENEQSAARAYTAVQERLRCQMRMTRQLAREEKGVERTRRQAQAANDRSLRQRIAFGTRMARQRAVEERQGEREHLARVSRLERQHALARRTVASRARDAFTSSGNAFERVTRAPATVAAIGTAATAAAARKVLMSESDTDAAEVDTRSYGNLTKEGARQLRSDWASPIAEQLGSTTSAMLRAWTEATKLGVPAEGARAFAELSTQTSEAWQVPFDSVTSTLGQVNSILTSAGAAFDFNKLKSVANTIQYLAAKMSTTPEKLTSFLQRGTGAAQLLGMSQEAGLAFGAASTSLGNESGTSGRLFDYISSRLTTLPRIMRGRGEDAKGARKLLQSLGYGGVAGLRAKQKENPDDFVFDFIERFNKITDATKRNEAIQYFAQTEWNGEFGRLVTGSSKVREAQKLATEAKDVDAIGDVWQNHVQKLSFVGKQIRAGFLNILGEFGTVLSPLARQVGDYFLTWSKSLRGGGLQARFRAALDGMLDGFGFRDVPDMLKGIFGEAGQEGGGSVESWRNFAKGFASGICEVAASIVAAFRAFSGGSSDPETMGRWTARILGFSAALKAASPVVDFLSGIGSAVMSFAQLVLSAWGALAVVRAVTGVGAVAGAAGAGAAVVGAPIAIFIAGLAGVATLAVTIMNWSAIREWIGGWTGSGAKDSDRSPIEKPKADLRWWEVDPMFHRQSFTPDQGLGDLIRNASFDAADELSANMRRLGEGFERFGAKYQLASLGASSTAGLSALRGGGGMSSSTSLPGRSGDPAQQFGRNFFTPQGMTPPTSGGSGAGTGGSRSWRNSNPGNLEYGPFARSMGATGSDGRFAIFPDYAAGRKAQEKLLFESSGYRDLNLGQAIRRWAPASENNVPTYVAAMGGDSGKRMSEYSPDQRARLLDAMQKHEGWKVGTTRLGVGQVTAGAMAPLGAGSAGVSDAAASLVGANSRRAAAALGANMTSGQWCADFVNGALQTNGIKGSGSSIANSFLKWGQSIDPRNALKGDVLVESRGRGAGAPGGHVGIATGRTRTNAQTGELEIEQTSGNYGGKVANSWERAGRLDVRRAFDVSPTAADLARSVPTPQSITSGIPVPPARPGGGAGQGGGASGGVVNNFHIDGGNQTPRQIADAVQRHVTESWSKRGHDLEPELT